MNPGQIVGPFSVGIAYQRKVEMRTFYRITRVALVLTIGLLLSYCDEDSNPTQNLPTGCQAQGVHAIAVLDSALTCDPTNAFEDTEEALGPPDGGSSGPGKLEFEGFVSLGIEGAVTLYMGSCIQDLAGADLRVFQSVSFEAVEVQVSQNQDGPFTSLGAKNCDGFCDFDLSGSGLNNVRVVKVIDREKMSFGDARCDNAGPSPGADLDSVQVLH